MQENPIDKLLSSLKNRNAAPQERERNVREAVGGLTPEQRARLEDILSSPEKMKAMLSSDRAKELMKKTGKQGE